jgi:hypothetical protein
VTADQVRDEQPLARGPRDRSVPATKRCGKRAQVIEHDLEVVYVRESGEGLRRAVDWVLASIDDPRIDSAERG